MRKQAVAPTGREARFGDDEIIVSKTDLKGRITCANDVFLKVTRYTEEEVLGQPHNFIGHPGMPACVFKLLWETLEGGQEIFAYVLNQAKNGDHYWVFAHVTPSYDKQGQCVGYHSNRRVPYPDAMPKVQALSHDTAKATGEIGQSVETMLEATKRAADALRRIGGSVKDIDTHQSAIRVSLSEQLKATGEIAHRITDISNRTREMDSGPVSLAA